MTLTSEKNFFRGSPGCIGNMPFRRKIVIPKKIDFWSTISKFGGQNCTFNTKQLSHSFPDMWVPKFLFPPLAITIFGPKTAKFCLKMAVLVTLGQIFASLVHFCAMSDQKTMGTRCIGDFLICWYQNHCSLPK